MSMVDKQFWNLEDSMFGHQDWIGSGPAVPQSRLQ